ncbi:DUF397 domain-containing protein [Streptomyces sp. NBC_00258]|uniref:DUF397 domain-containing protein n=1 Tax=Streptomyces sp. NBC_00258 TaxID=2903642 RepID=UPI002E28654E|nr:DUF397 domain-containing protein [Streptomyces sp. NBC_00258]
MPETPNESLSWTKSTYTDSGSCVEWARPAGGVLVRDSKRPVGPRVRLSGNAWQAFAHWAGKQGEAL